MPSSLKNQVIKSIESADEKLLRMIQALISGYHSKDSVISAPWLVSYVEPLNDRISTPWLVSYAEPLNDHISSPWLVSYVEPLKD